MARRKQRRPQHLENEKELASTLQNGIGSGSDTEEDEHVCGKCRAEFPSLSEFLEHKKKCVSKRPVLVVPPHDSSAETDDDEEEGEELANDDRLSPQTLERHKLLLSQQSSFFWGNLNPLMLLAQHHRSDTNVTLEELKNTNVAVAQHGSAGEVSLRDFLNKFRQSQVESLQLIKTLEHIIVQNNVVATAQQALIGTAALTPPQTADGPAMAPSAPLSSNVAAYPQGGKTEDDSQTPIPENSLALLEKQAERYIQDSMARRSFLLNGLDEDKSKKRNEDPALRHRCNFCGKHLGSDSALQIHLRSHTGEKPFSCNVCGSSFSTRGNLKVHYQRHRDNNELASTTTAAAAIADSPQAKKPQDKRNTEGRPDIPPMLYPSDSVNKEDSTKGDQALDFTTTMNGRKSPNADNSRSVSPNDMFNYSENSDGSSDENMTAENFSELKIDVERDDEDDRDNSNMDEDASEVASSQAGFESSPNFAPYFLPSSYSNFSVTSTPNNNNVSTNNNEGADSILQDPTYYQDLLPKIGSNDNSWESLIEVTKTSETSKLQQLVDNIEHKLIEPNQCIICHRVLSCKSALQMHYRTHTGERPFKCKLCSRAFTTKGNLKTHMGVHRTKPATRLMHQCPVCHKPFPNSVLLQQHVRTHTENPSLQVPLYNSCEERPPTLLPPSFPRQYLLPPQLLNSEPLALTNNKGQDQRTTTNESVIKTTGMETSAPQNPCASPTLSTASSGSHSCNMEENASKELQPPVLDLAQPEADYPNEEKMNHSPSEIPKITEGNSSPERREALGSSPTVDRLDYEVKQEPPNLANSPKSPVANQESGITSPSSATAKSPHKFNPTEISPIVSLACDRPLPMSLPSDCPLPFSVLNSDRPYPPMSVPDFTTGSLTALENHVKGITSNVTHPVPFPPHFGLGLNVPSFYRDYNFSQKQSPPSGSKNGSDGSADERSTPGSSNKNDSSIRLPLVNQSNSKPENSNGALDLTPRNSPGFQRPAGTEMKIFAPLAGLPFGPPHHRLGTTCRICYKTFACQSALEIHYRSHTKERPFRCEVCDRGFSTKGNMRQHMLTHKIRDLPAQIFSSNSSSSNNITTNSSSNNNNSHNNNSSAANNNNSNSSPIKPESNEEKSPKKTPEESIKRPPTSEPALPLPQPKRPPGQPKHLCQVCNKPFSSGSALQIHMRTHTGDKPFQCHICQRAFTTKGNLKVHMGTHVWNNSTSRRGRRMSLDISPLQLNPGPKPGEFAQTPYFPYLPPFMNGLPPPQPPPKMNEISVIQTAGLSNGAAVSTAVTANSPNMPQQPLPLLSASKRDETTLPQNQNHLTQSSESHPVIQPSPEIAVSWPWKISCKVCNKICSSSTELEMHVRNNHSKRESPESLKAETVQ